MRGGMDRSWQMRAALLILQQGYQALRAERREKVHGERLQLPTPRMIARDKEIRARASREEEDFAYTPIDLERFGLDQEDDGGPAGVVRKKPSRSRPHVDTGKYAFIPIDLGNLGPDENDYEPTFLQPVTPAPLGIAQDILSPPGSYSPAVPNTQSHSGELTP